MPSKVILTQAARADRRRVRAWYLQPGAGPIARKRLALLEAAIANLAHDPAANLIDQATGVRLLITQRHRGFYEIQTERRRVWNVGDVVVLRIYGPGQEH